MSAAGSLRLNGAPNFRDLGDSELGDRRLIRGKVFRSGHFGRLTPDDVDKLKQIPLRTIVDLRADFETQLFVSSIPIDAGIAVVNVVTNPYAGASGDAYKAILRDDPTPGGALKTITATYQLLPAACGPALKAVIDLILDGGAPLVFHCSNGRDRTGVISMMLQHLLGVSRDIIVADYVASNARIDIESAVVLSRTVFIKEFGIDFSDETLRAMNQALAQNVETTINTIHSQYGSTDHYFDSFGINGQRRKALRNVMLEGTQ